MSARPFRTFSAKCRSLLADDGVMLMHTIGRGWAAGPTDSWTAKYIFPGGYIPACRRSPPPINEPA